MLERPLLVPALDPLRLTCKTASRTRCDMVNGDAGDEEAVTATAEGPDARDPGALASVTLVGAVLVGEVNPGNAKTVGPASAETVVVAVVEVVGSEVRVRADLKAMALIPDKVCKK